VEALAGLRRPAPRTAGPRWLPAAVIGGLLVLIFVVSQSCQQSQIRLTKDQAIAKAERQVSFDPTRTQVRLVRQGLGSKPFWIVSLSIPGDDGTFAQLAVVRVNANTGKVASVQVQRPEPSGR
jgi:hypothetical protein